MTMLEISEVLFKDRTTEKNIILAAESYQPEYSFSSHVTMDLAKLIKPRHQKGKKEQASRTSAKAEVFTPSWICNMQNSLVDDEWFGRKNVFSIPDGRTWTAVPEKIQFPSGKTWQDYVLLKKLEITCGEAPYIASPYDTVSGEIIPVQNRIGFLDRKLRVVCENASVDDWYFWAEKAFQCAYGFEYQGDNLLIARKNVLRTFFDFVQFRFGCEPQKDRIETISDIISWNLWQMDGLTFTIPGTSVPAKVKDFETGEVLLFRDLTGNRLEF